MRKERLILNFKIQNINFQSNCGVHKGRKQPLTFMLSLSLKHSPHS